ncbi:DDE superfamily endonuclease [Hirsutella rhossiliensis]
MTEIRDQSIPREERVLLAVKAYQQGQFDSTHKAATAYDIPHSTVSGRLRGARPRRDAQMNNRKLTATEETASYNGMPPTVVYTRRMANLLLSERGQETVGENWVRKFVGRHDEIKAKYSRRYDYQRAKCEGPKTIQEWYDRVAMAKQKWGILDEDVYNFDKTGGESLLGLTGEVGLWSCSQEIENGVTVIESINCLGWVLPAMVIFQGKVHQASWYKAGVPKDWQIAVSDKWTSDDLGLHWLKAVFDPYTRRRTVGTRRLLILDGHGSHVTPEFDKYCTDNAIVVLQMPANSSHLLQPLDVGCFSPLKTIYGQKVQEKMLAGTLPVEHQMWIHGHRPFSIQSDPGLTGIATMMHGNNLSRRSRPDGREKKSYASQDSLDSSELTCLFVSWTQLPSVRVASVGNFERVGVPSRHAGKVERAPTGIRLRRIPGNQARESNTMHRIRPYAGYPRTARSYRKLQGWLAIPSRAHNFGARSTFACMARRSSRQIDRREDESGARRRSSQEQAAEAGVGLEARAN